MKAKIKRTSAITIVFFCLLFFSGFAEQADQYTLSSTTKIELSEAEAQGLVRVKASGRGLVWLKIELESLSDLPLEIEIVPGTIFEAQSARTQNMVIRERKVVYLEPKEIKILELLAACINMRRDVPDEHDSFTIRETLTPEKLLSTSELHLMELLHHPEFLEETFRVQQDAIWTITENPSDRTQYVRIGYIENMTYPSTTEMCRILTLFEDVGIPIEEYNALHNLTCEVCRGYDLWERKCVYGTCEDNRLIEANSEQCGYEPCINIECRDICKEFDLWSQKCVEGYCVDDSLIEANSVQCGFDPCAGHCSNEIQDCGEYGVDCGGGCPVVDSDTDGVEDCIDLCPDTLCDRVDANGCETDTDEDSMSDCEDECPNERGDPSTNGCPTNDYVWIIPATAVVGGVVAYRCFRNKGEPCEEYMYLCIRFFVVDKCGGKDEDGSTKRGLLKGATYDDKNFGKLSEDAAQSIENLIEEASKIWEQCCIRIVPCLDKNGKPFFAAFDPKDFPARSTYPDKITVKGDGETKANVTVTDEYDLCKMYKDRYMEIKKGTADGEVQFWKDVKWGKNDHVRELSGKEGEVVPPETLKKELNRLIKDYEKRMKEATDDEYKKYYLDRIEKINKRLTNKPHKTSVDPLDCFGKAVDAKFGKRCLNVFVFEDFEDKDTEGEEAGFAQMPGRVILLDESVITSPEKDGNVLAHEIGHNLGLDHHKNVNNVMHIPIEGNKLDGDQCSKANEHLSKDENKNKLASEGEREKFEEEQRIEEEEEKKKKEKEKAEKDAKTKRDQAREKNDLASKTRDEATKLREFKKTAEEELKQAKKQVGNAKKQHRKAKKDVRKAENYLKRNKRDTKRKEDEAKSKREKARKKGEKAVELEKKGLTRSAKNRQKEAIRLKEKAEKLEEDARNLREEGNRKLQEAEDALKEAEASMGRAEEKQARAEEKVKEAKDTTATKERNEKAKELDSEAESLEEDTKKLIEEAEELEKIAEDP